jgi:choline dehydrogenase-like flavoprotein
MAWCRTSATAWVSVTTSGAGWAATTPGTGRVGSDAAGVVDPQLRMHELTGLWVADQSVMPTIPNARVLAIAEWAAGLIRKS